MAGEELDSPPFKEQFLEDHLLCLRVPLEAYMLQEWASVCGNP